MDTLARERFQPSAEASEEVQVITNQFSAEYGSASGGRTGLTITRRQGIYRSPLLSPRLRGNHLRLYSSARRRTTLYTYWPAAWPEDHAHWKL